MIVEHLAADLAAIRCQQSIQLVPHRLCRLVADVNVSDGDDKMVRCKRLGSEWIGATYNKKQP